MHEYINSLMMMFIFDMIRKYVDEFFADHKITDYKVYEYNSGDEAAKNNEKD